MSLAPVREDELAAVVTYLEMRSPPPVGDSPHGDCPLSLKRVERPELDRYRTLFRRVGAPWLWSSRLVMDDAKLAGIIQDRAVELYAVIDADEADCGMLELDFREPGQCELAFVGLVPELSGQGHGRWLLAEALSLAWGPGITRVHVHTCSLDHPAALGAYRRAGFVPFKRAIETFPDPRLLGILPRTSAPQVPLLGTETSAASRPASCA